MNPMKEMKKVLSKERPIATFTVRGAGKMSEGELRAIIHWMWGIERVLISERKFLSNIYSAKYWNREE